MTVTINGTTGITTPDLTSADDITANGSTVLTAATSPAALPLAGGAMTGAITTNSTFDGRDVSVDGAKLDGIAAGANNYSFPYNVSQGEGANTLVQRDPAGYLFANYFNGSGTFATTGATSGMGRFTGTNGSDTYGRSYTAAAARTLLNVADGATNVTNTNQLTNGAGYITGYTETDTFSTVATRGNSYINGTNGGISVGETFNNYAGWNTQLNVHGGPHCRLTVKTDTVQMGVYAHDTWQPVSGVTPGGFVGTYNNYPLSFLVNTQQKMVINTSGNVGIGVTSPTQKLDVNGTVKATAFSGNGSGLTGISAPAVNYSSGVSSSYGGTNTAPSDGVYVVRMYGSYINGMVVYAGPTSANVEVGRFGDDINSNTKADTGVWPVKAGTKFLVQHAIFSWAWESVWVTFYPSV